MIAAHIKQYYKNVLASFSKLTSKNTSTVLYVLIMYICI